MRPREARSGSGHGRLQPIPQARREEQVPPCRDQNSEVLGAPGGLRPQSGDRGATFNDLHEAMSLPLPGLIRNLATRTQASPATITAQKSRKMA